MMRNHFVFMRTASLSLDSGRVRLTSFIIDVWRTVALSLLVFVIAPCISAAEGKHSNLNSKSDGGLQSFQDWAVRCVAAPLAADSKQLIPVQAVCEAAQTVTVDQNGQKAEILKLAISPAKDKAEKSDWALIVLFPLDLLLNSDFGLSIGKEKPTLYRFRNCNHLGCFGVVPLDKSMLGRFRKSADGAVYFRLLNGRTVKVLFSLRGFEVAFEALQSRSKVEERNNSTGSGIKK